MKPDLLLYLNLIKDLNPKCFKLNHFEPCGANNII